MPPPFLLEAGITSSWFDRSHDGEGYIVEVLVDSRVVVFWFSYDPQGKRRWFFSTGEIRDGKLVIDDMLTSIAPTIGQLHYNCCHQPISKETDQ